MKLNVVRRNRNQGSMLVITIVICALVGLMLSAYLSMVSSQHVFTQRSQIWNSCLPMCEAGVEEALAHLNHVNTVSNFAMNGWVRDGTGIHHKNLQLNDGEARMQIDSSYPPIITVQGRLRAPLGNGLISRAVRVRTRLNQRFPNAILARGGIDMGGGARVDSFNSTNANESTGGLYDPAKATDHASIATVSRTPGDLNLGNADIYGKVATGPGGTVSVGPNGNVGSTEYNNDPSKNGTVEPGHYTDDVNLQIEDGKLPEPFGPTFIPGSGKVGATTYEYVLNNGDYRISSISLSAKQKLIVTGKARIYVTGATLVQGQAEIIISPGASVEWYAGGNVDLGGGGVMNTAGFAKNFSIIGLNTCTSISYAGNSGFIGTIYAPSAAIKMTGTADASGAFVGKTFKITGTMDIHYDEALREVPSRGRFLAQSWEEIKWEEINL